MRQLLRIPSRVGRPGTLLHLQEAGGRLMYLTAAVAPTSITAALEADDVRQVVTVLTAWLMEHDELPANLDRAEPCLCSDPRGAHMRGMAGCMVAECPCLVYRSPRTVPATVQNRTVRPPEQRGRGELLRLAARPPA